MILNKYAIELNKSFMIIYLINLSGINTFDVKLLKLHLHIPTSGIDDGVFDTQPIRLSIKITNFLWNITMEFLKSSIKLHNHYLLPLTYLTYKFNAEKGTKVSI